MKRSFLVIALAQALLMSSCVKMDERVQVKELAPAQKYCVVGIDGAQESVMLYSNGHCTLNIEGAPAWVNVSPMEFDGDAEVSIKCQPNDGIRRQAKVVMTMDSLRDTLYVRQEGEEEYLRFSSAYQTIAGSKSIQVDPGMQTNIPAQRIEAGVVYPDGAAQWIDFVTVSAEGCVIAAKSNPSHESTRGADVVFKYTDGWEQTHIEVLHLTQKTADDQLGLKITASQARNLDGSLRMTNNRYEGDYIVEGVVVSDCDNLNLAGGSNTGYNVVDRGENKKTMFLQELQTNGGGICFKWSDPEANNIHRGTKLTINLKGLTLRDANAPGVTILGLASTNIMEIEEGVEVPVRERSVASLTDDDINTWVTLTDMEFVFKQGAYTNVREAYQLKSELNAGVKNVTNAVDAVARLLCDDKGDAIFMQINSLVPWRRKVNSDAEGRHGVPQGVGPVSGILVSEANSRYGASVGRYSLRPLQESDIAIEWESATTHQVSAEWIFDHRNPTDVYANAKGYPDRVYTWAEPFQSGNSAAMNYINKMCATGGDASALLYCNNLSWPVDKVYTRYGTATDNNADQIYTNIINNRPQFADGFESPYVWGGDDWGVNFEGVWHASDDVMNTYRSDGKGVYHYCGDSDYSNYIWVSNLSGWYEWEGDNPVGRKGFIVETPGASLLAFSIGAGGYPARQWNMLYAWSDGFYNTSSGYYAQNYPLYWKVEYSLDGGLSWNDDALEATTGENEFKMLPIPWWSAPVYKDPASGEASGTAYINLETCPGLVEHMYKLPQAASSAARLMLRIVPSKAVVATLSVGEGNFKAPLDQGVTVTKDASFGNMIHVGGVRLLK